MTRNQEIRRRRLSGEKLRTIGKAYGISRQRVYQLCSDIPDINRVRRKLDRHIAQAILWEKKGWGQVDRFWSHVDKTSSDEGCWLWTGTAYPAGYGKLGEGVYAHRFSWEMHNSRVVPNGLQTQHLCNNPPCVNPAHLVIGTMWENLRYRDMSGRSGSAKLTSGEVRAIREIWALGKHTSVALAEKYPVSARSIRSLVNRETYRWVV